MLQLFDAMQLDLTNRNCDKYNYTIVLYCAFMNLLMHSIFV